MKHKPLLNQLLDPQFIACNGCLSNKKDFALSISLLAAIKSIELLMNEVCTSKSLSPEAFQSVMIEELKNMNISDPLKGLKEKGQVGQDLIGKFAGVFYTGMQKSLLSTSATNNFSMDTLPQCPATVSVVGAITSQEAIKAITHIYMPVSQFMMIESLDALPDSNNPMIEESPAKNHTIKTEVELIYGDELAEELRRMKIFIVGSGAIGCELLKTFALLGIGEGSKFYSSTDTKSIDPSGIVVNRHCYRYN